MILDDAVDSRETKLTLSPRDMKRVREARFRAKRFIFDEDASAKAGRFATECADVVCEHSQFALPPFPNTYIELDHIAAIRASSRIPVSPDMPQRIGFLFFEDGDLLVCVGGELEKSAFTPFRYHRKEAAERGVSLPENHNWLRDFLIGEVSADLRPKVDAFAHHVTDVWSASLTVPLPGPVLDVMETECRGEMKRALAAALLLNQKRGVAVRDQRPVRRISRGKLKTYMAHSVVSIDLGGGDLRGFFSVDSRASPRRHEVRGHFVHYGIDEACGHEWEPHSTPELERRDLDRSGKPVLRWRCATCGGLRVRRESFHRGDATRGFVTKSYQVKG